MSRLQVTEIYRSIQGESTHAGRPTAFVRLTGCGLRCRYCDTGYAFGGGRPMSLDEVLSAVASFGIPLVEITGGEPLEQDSAPELMRRLLDGGYTVMLETGGHVSLRGVPEAVIKIIDVKCPGSGEGGTFLEENLTLASPHDEFKLVLSSRHDYDWAREFVRGRLGGLPNPVLFSPAHGLVDPAALAGWILEDRLVVRLQLQLHKYVWPPGRRGV
jgi:7-carboxy-7-deazaguanine synthase